MSQRIEQILNEQQEKADKYTIALNNKKITLKQYEVLMDDLQRLDNATVASLEIAELAEIQRGLDIIKQLAETTIKAMV